MPILLFGLVSWSMLVASGCTSASSKECTAEALLERVSQVKEQWEVQKPASMSQGETFFSPIMAIAFDRGNLWIRTYGSDFLPAKAKVVNNRILLEQITYNFAPADSNVNQIDGLVRKYNVGEWKYELLVPGECADVNRLILLISPPSSSLGKIERVVLYRHKKQDRSQ